MFFISQVTATNVARNAKLLQPPPNFVPHIIQYCDKIREAGKAKENVHFLKLERKQLEALRDKAMRDKQYINKKLAELEKEIENAEECKNEEKENCE